MVIEILNILTKLKKGIFIYFSISEQNSKTDITKTKSEENYKDSYLQKGLEFSRRNSYSDLSKCNIFVISIKKIVHT